MDMEISFLSDPPLLTKHLCRYEDALVVVPADGFLVHAALRWVRCREGEDPVRLVKVLGVHGHIPLKLRFHNLDVVFEGLFYETADLDQPVVEHIVEARVMGVSPPREVKGLLFGYEKLDGSRLEDEIVPPHGEDLPAIVHSFEEVLDVRLQEPLDVCHKEVVVEAIGVTAVLPSQVADGILLLAEVK